MNLQLLTLIAAVIIFLVSLYVSHRNHRDAQESVAASLELMQQQIREQLYAEYARRHHDITVNLAAENVSESAMGMKPYFDLCHEEYRLWMNCQIDSEMWQSWKRDMIATMRRLHLGESWVGLKEMYAADFVIFFDNEIAAAAL